MSKTSRQAIASTATTPIDFKVDPKTGVGYISQRKAAELCGVSQQSIQQFCLSEKINVNQGLTDETLFLLVTHYALDSKRANPTAKGTLRSFAYAGARAYIYYHAGVQVHTSTNNKLHEPCVPVRWLAQQLGRSRSSVDRTINVSIRRLKDYAVSQEVAYVQAERCVSPALILCCMFTGKQMQAARGWLLTLAETDTLPAPEVMLQLTSPLLPT